jgi:membrane fusion protein, multidrug efflux system
VKISKNIKYLAVIVGIAALVFGAIFLRIVRTQEHNQAVAPALAPWALYSATVEQKTVTSSFLALATKKADSEVMITPQISGTITKMGPREGQPFQPGTVLARIDASQINDEIAALRANLNAAKEQESFLKKELERQQTLLTKGFSTREKTEGAQTAYLAAKEKTLSLGHQLSQLKTQRGYTVISADKSGTVAARLAEPGNLAVPGKPIYRLSVAGITRFSVMVPQAVLNQLQIGSRVEMNAGNKKITAPITRINQTLDPLSMGSVNVDLETAPFGLPIGARIPVRVITKETQNAFYVPITAIAWSADGKSGYVVKVVEVSGTSTLHKVPVTISQASSDGAAIKGDIKPGDRVIIAQQAVLLKLKTGDPVMIAKGAVQ